MRFGEALTCIQDKENHNYDFMRLPQWAEDVKIKIQTPDAHSKMSAPYLYVESRFGNVPWKETMIEMFSDKWEVA